MSIAAINWAWSQEAPTSTAKLVLVALADHADDEGECFPSMGRVAELAQCSTRQVSRCVDSLEDAGLLTRKRRRMSGGKLGGYSYRLAVHRTPTTTGHPRPVDTGDQLTPEAPTTGHPRPSPPDTDVRTEPPVEPPPEPKPSMPDFQSDFWERYPKRDGKRVGRKQAKAQWDKLTAKDRRLVVIAVGNYADAADDPRIFCPIKDPWRWLRDRFFDDWQEPPEPDLPKQLVNAAKFTEGGRF